MSDRNWRSSSRGGRQGGGSWRKPGGHASYRRKGPPLPRINIKEHLVGAYSRARSERSYFQEVRDLHSKYRIPMNQLFTCSLHIFAEHDDLRMVETLFKQHVTEEEERKEMSNSTQGAHEYTPLCRALYSGSPKLVATLVAAGSDVNFVNGHGEGLDAALDAGRAAALERLPDETIFIHERFKECSDFIAKRRQWLIDQESREQTRTPWRPLRHHRLATRIQAAARGMLTRDRLRRSSLGPKGANSDGSIFGGCGGGGRVLGRSER